MISIRHSLEEIEQREECERLLRECYAAAIQAMREYAIEIEPGAAARFRQRMEQIEQDLAAALSAEEYKALQSSFRGELRHYRDRCREMLTRLRNEVSAAAVAIQTLTESVSTNGAGYEAELNREVSRLEEAATMEDLNSIRTTINTSAAAIQHSFEQMRQRNEAAVAQLQDEIRGLHKTMETERRALYTDAASGAWNQRKLAERFDQLLKLDESFAVLLLAIANWRTTARQHSPQAADACLKALVAHLQAKFGAEGLVGRWSDDVLAVIIETDPAAAADTAAIVTQELAAGFPPGALDRTGPILHIQSCMVGRERSANASEFYPQLGQRVAALTA
ncbi:MAG TPA: GGDEF domain-containing protein [Bryobacteraceae bacterium]|nr:GGDEF domain-containing protein [Bryobacteraceae bacterium]